MDMEDELGDDTRYIPNVTIFCDSCGKVKSKNVNLKNNRVTNQSKQVEELLPDNWNLNYRNSDVKKVGFF